MITLIDIGIYLLWLIPVFIIHELGHYVAYRFYGIKPKVQMHWWGMSVGEEKDSFKLTPAQFLFMLYTGVFVGMVYTWQFNNITFNFSYLAMCLADLVNMWHCLKNYKSKESFGNVYIKLLGEQIKSLRLARWEK